MKDKLLIIGLDCAEPELVFERWADSLPTLRGLMERGVYGRLRSTLPPITVPAWTAMMTSQDPGMLGFYGFRNRKSYGYEDLYLANAQHVKAKTIWNHLSRHRRRSLVVGVPQTYPPKPLNGVMVADFLTPDKSAQYTYPPELRETLDRAAGGNYIIDVEDFRTHDKERLLDAIYKMTRARFRAFRHLLAKDDFDFAIVVEMGPDRMHHGFWRYFDNAHRLYEPGNRYEHVIRDYYCELDEEVSRTIEAAGPDTSVMVVSDHGAKRMVGAICINEWLQQEGYLSLKNKPAQQTPMTLEMIDWKHTKAWGEGGYYCRLFMNVEGREPNGIVPQADYERLRDEMRQKLEAMTDEEGRCINTRVFKPEKVYRDCKNIPPDLIVYLGNLDWRSAGSVGVGSVHIYENDTGPDDANHTEEGIFIWDAPSELGVKCRNLYSIYDIAPTILHYFGVEVPEEMIGRSLIER